MKSIALSWSQKKDVDFLVQVLKKEGVILGSSDTVLGFLATLTAGGFKTLNRLKQRSSKPYLILVGSEKKVFNFSDDFKKDPIKKLIKFFWPGPLTIIVQAKSSLPAYMCSDDRTVAIRVPNHEGLLSLLKNFDGLFSTSVNKSGEPVFRFFSKISSDIFEKVECCVGDDEDINKEYPEVASTIVDCTVYPFKIVRLGVISKNDLEKKCGKIFI